MNWAQYELPGEHRAPVGDVAERGERVAPDLEPLRGGGQQCGVQRDADEHTEQGGEEPSGAPGPEGREADPVGPRELRRGAET